MASTPNSVNEPSAKRAKTTESSSNGTDTTDLPFHPTLLNPENVRKLSEAHHASQPYKHAVIDQLFEPDFLDKARQEIVEHISFREKETDIYRINQTGDLTNLSGLPAEELALLPTLLKLRDSIYSQTFRSFLQTVTGCGPLSGTKTDMSCAEYNQGCYLLNHDDVIGTRRISFILYLVLEEPKWQPEVSEKLGPEPCNRCTGLTHLWRLYLQWGGALELYPVLEADNENPDRPNVPVAKPSVSIPPAFNQFNFFEVQPGHSFHSVEEVVVYGDGEKGGKGARLSLSGWFHKPVEGEIGYEGNEAYAAKSSLQQLYATTLSPAIPYEVEPILPLPTLPSEQEIAVLSTLINPAYLNQKTLSQLLPQFVESSQLVLANFLRPEIAIELENLIREQDLKLENLFGGRRGKKVNKLAADRIPDQSYAEDEDWELIGPPHIQRFCALKQKPTASKDRLAEILKSIQDLIVSPAFRSLLSCFTALLPLGYTCHVRRFRPGLDYTLARGEPESSDEAKLDLSLGLTPLPKNKADQELWAQGTVGGWEIWLAVEEGGDEATYGNDKKAQEAASEPSAPAETTENVEAEAENSPQDEEDLEDGPLLSLEPSWNQLTLVLRDPGVLKFVKYLSASCPASRWDISGEWQVGQAEEENSDKEE